MQPTFARFASAPIGPLLAARNGGLVLDATGAANINRVARSDVAVSSGTRGVEFAVWGDDALSAIVGVLGAGAPLNNYLGATSSGIGWRLAQGDIRQAGAVLASGLPAVAKGEIVGVRVVFGTPNTIEFYKGNTLVHSRELTIAAPLHFGASLAATEAGKQLLIVNSGQYMARSPAAKAGWYTASATLTAKLADLDYLSAASDTPSHTRYEGLVLDGLTAVAQIGFWPWSDEPPLRAGAASCRLLDPDGLLDAAALQDIQGTQVVVRLAKRNGDVASAMSVARYTVDRVEIQSDTSKQIVLADPHDDLDRPLSRGEFLPNMTNSALHWTPLPVVIGAVASVPALVCNSDGTALFLSDAPLADVSVVMDRGDVMEAGTYTVAPGAQQISMTSPSIGPVVSDASSVGAGMQPATLLQFLHAAFGRIGKTNWSSADAAAIDAATGYAGIGYYTRESGEAGSVRQALARVLPSFGAWYWDDAGILRFARIVAPETYVGELAFDLERGLLDADLVAQPDMARNLTRRWTYRPNAQALGASDLVTDVVDVPQWRRDELTGLSRGQVFAAGALPARYRQADTVSPFASYFWRAEDAQAEADRVIGMYGTLRNFYAVTYTGEPGKAPQPGQIGRLTYPKYDLAAGKKLLVRGRTFNPATGKTTLALWG